MSIIILYRNGKVNYNLKNLASESETCILTPLMLAGLFPKSFLAMATASLATATWPWTWYRIWHWSNSSKASRFCSLSSKPSFYLETSSPKTLHRAVSACFCFCANLETFVTQLLLGIRERSGKLCNALDELFHSSLVWRRKPDFLSITSLWACVFVFVGTNTIELVGKPYFVEWVWLLNFTICAVNGHFTDLAPISPEAIY